MVYMDQRTISEGCIIHCGGKIVTIRPIRLTDQALESDFVSRLSAESRSFRVVGALREMPASTLYTFADADGHYSMAFVATTVVDGSESVVGVSRYAPRDDEEVREMAVAVAEDWQETELAQRLARELIEYAGDRGVREMTVVDVAENPVIKSLVDALDMTRHDNAENSPLTNYRLPL